jgi:hypothetical protein
VEFVLAVAGQNGSALAAGPSNGFSEFADPSNNQSFAACFETSTTGTQHTQWVPAAFAGSYAAAIAAYKLVIVATPTPTATATATPTATPTPGFVQQAGTTSNGVSSIAPSFSGNASAGNTVAVFFNSKVLGSLDTLTLSGMGATWVKLGCFLATGGTLQTCIYAGVVVTPSATVTISKTSNNASTATIAEYSGLLGTITQDGTVTTGSGTGTTAQPSAYTSSHAHDLILCEVGHQSGSSFSSAPGSPWNNLTAQLGLGISGQGTYQIVTSTASFQPQWGGPNVPWIAMCSGIEW